MPIYEFVCDVCSIEIERLQGMDEPPPTCPADEQHGQMRKKVSKTNFRLEGGGWSGDGYAR